MNYLLYLDPGSGSYLVQALVAGALGVVFFFKNIVLYIRGFFAILTGRRKTPAPSAEPDPQNSTDQPRH